MVGKQFLGAGLTGRYFYQFPNTFGIDSGGMGVAQVSQGNEP
jgi:hypothetical protein